MMLGAIIGDIAGSRFERENRKSKEFTFFTPRCHPTDDSSMTLAIALAILRSRGERRPQGPISRIRITMGACGRSRVYTVVNRSSP